MAGYIKKNNEFIPLTGDGYGLPLGTWISYEGDCPDGFIESEQTFNTTTYALLYAMLGTNKVPARFDHSKLSNWESLSYSANTDIEMQYDGILYVTKNSANSAVCEIKINGVLVTSVYTNTNAYSNANISFRKGQVLNISYAGTEVVVGVMYYKRHLAIKATPAYVEPDTVSDMFNLLKSNLKAIVADSSDFADFKTKMANW